MIAVARSLHSVLPIGPAEPQDQTQLLSWAWAIYAHVEATPMHGRERAMRTACEEFYTRVEPSTMPVDRAPRSRFRLIRMWDWSYKEFIFANRKVLLIMQTEANLRSKDLDMFLHESDEEVTSGDHWETLSSNASSAPLSSPDESDDSGMEQVVNQAPFVEVPAVDDPEIPQYEDAAAPLFEGVRRS
jgi:hypothetical protein